MTQSKPLKIALWLTPEECGVLLYVLLRLDRSQLSKILGTAANAQVFATASEKLRAELLRQHL
jgi:hypothetical protein